MTYKEPNPFNTKISTAYHKILTVYNKISILYHNK